MKFTKMHGAGNDFILLDDRDGSIGKNRYSALAVLLCHRQFSIGADGVMYILNAKHGGDYAMLFYNSDGSLGEMCGNGARCIARYGFDHGLAGTTQRIETTAGMVIGERIERERYRIRLPDPSVLRSGQSLETPFGKFGFTYIVLGDPGIPHAVCEPFDWEKWPRDRLYELGRILRQNPALPKGANVTFLRRSESNLYSAITFERGVEDFTLACGTGAGSSAAALTVAGMVSDGPVSLQFPGGLLTAELTRKGSTISDIYLTGPAVTVAEGDCPQISNN